MLDMVQMEETIIHAKCAESKIAIFRACINVRVCLHDWNANDYFIYPHLQSVQQSQEQERPYEITSATGFGTEHGLMFYWTILLLQ